MYGRNSFYLVLLSQLASVTLSREILRQSDGSRDRADNVQYAIDVLTRRLLFYSGDEVYSEADQGNMFTNMSTIVSTYHFNHIILESLSTVPVAPDTPMSYYGSLFYWNTMDAGKKNAIKNLLGTDGHLTVGCGDYKDSIDDLYINSGEKARSLAQLCSNYMSDNTEFDSVNIRLNFKSKQMDTSDGHTSSVLSKMVDELSTDSRSIYLTIDEDVLADTGSIGPEMTTWLQDNNDKLSGLIVRYLHTDPTTVQPTQYSNMFGDFDYANLYPQSMLSLNDTKCMPFGKIIPVKPATRVEPTTKHDADNSYFDGFISWDELLFNGTQVANLQDLDFTGYGVWASRVRQAGDSDRGIEETPNNYNELCAIGELYDNIEAGTFDCQDPLCGTCALPAHCDKCIDDAEFVEGKCKYICDVDNCSSCSAKNICESCSDDYESDGDGCKLICNVTGCVSDMCDTFNHCQECDVGYALDPEVGGSCIKTNCAMMHCLKCETDLQVCTECDSGDFEITDDICVNLCNVDNCHLCVSGHDDKCQKCEATFTVENDQCVDECQVENCSDCASNPHQCSSCNSGYHAEDGACVITCANHCESCSNSGECDDCKTDYGLTPAKKCEKCLVTKCQDCSSDFSACQTCNEHHIYSNASCSQCEDSYGKDDNQDCTPCSIESCEKCSSDKDACELCTSDLVYDELTEECVSGSIMERASLLTALLFTVLATLS